MNTKFCLGEWQKGFSSLDSKMTQEEQELWTNRQSSRHSHSLLWAIFWSQIVPKNITQFEIMGIGLSRNLGTYYNLQDCNNQKHNVYFALFAPKWPTEQLGSYSSKIRSICLKTKQITSIVHPNLVIVNEPVRPLLFTISNNSLYQIW